MHYNFSNSTLPMDYSHIRRQYTIGVTALRVLGIWELIICVLGTPLNLLTLYLTIHLIRNYQANYNRWFILGMTLADLLFTTVHSPISFVRYFLHYPLNGVWCKTLFLSTHTSTVASSLNLLWLNCDKFVYMNKPLHYHFIINKRRAIFLTLMSGLVSVSWSVLFVFGPFNHWSNNCKVSTVRHYLWLYIVFAVIFFVVPTLASLAISVYVASVAFHARSRDTYERRVNRRSNDPNWVRTLPASRWKTITFVFTTTVWSAFTCLPYRIIYVMLTLKIIPSARGAYIVVYFTLLGLLAANAVGNPLITVMTQSLYRMKVWQILGFGRPRRRGGERGDRTEWSSSYSSISTVQVARV